MRMAKSDGDAERAASEAVHRPQLGVIATVREDGSPEATPVWIGYDGENVLVDSAHGRTKVKNIERDPTRDCRRPTGREPAGRLRDGEQPGRDRRGGRARAHQHAREEVPGRGQVSVAR